MELKLNVHKIGKHNEDKAETPIFNIGDLVGLKSHPLYGKLQYKSKLAEFPEKENLISLAFNPIKADPHAIPPVMVVIEVVKDANKDSIKYDEEGNKIGGGIFRYKCQFYSIHEGKFKDFWFYADLLAKGDFDFCVEKSKKEHSRIVKLLEECSIGKNVELKTQIFEIGKEKWSEVISKESQETISIAQHKDITKEKYHQDKNDNKLNPPENITRNIDREMNGEITVTHLLSHLPPSLVVTGIEKNKDTNGIYRTKADGSRETIREVSLYKIKCMWYNPIDCKFSEEWFIPEALISIEENKKE